MQNKDIIQTIDDTINDLHNKINEINNISDNGSTKIVAVKSVTIDVLNNVLAKLESTDRQNIDVQEMEKGLQTVTDKSKQLYENALFKIKQYNEELIKDNYSNNHHKQTNKDDISNKAIEILNEWLMPKDE